MRHLRSPGPALGCLLIIILIVVCGSGTLFVADRICYGNLSQRLPIYPNATVERRTHNLFTEFGMGNTVIIMNSPDAPSTVRSWYALHTGTYLREALQNDTPFFRMAQGQVDVTRSEDGAGSQIILFGTCIN